MNRTGTILTLILTPPAHYAAPSNRPQSLLPSVHRRHLIASELTLEELRQRHAPTPTPAKRVCRYQARHNAGKIVIMRMAYHPRHPGSSTIFTYMLPTTARINFAHVPHISSFTSSMALQSSRFQSQSPDISPSVFCARLDFQISARPRSGPGPFLVRDSRTQTSSSPSKNPCSVFTEWIIGRMARRRRRHRPFPMTHAPNPVSTNAHAARSRRALWRPISSALYDLRGRSRMSWH